LDDREGSDTVASVGGRTLWVLVIGLSCSLPVPAHAATYTVTNTSDSGAGSLRAAMTSAAASVADDTIAFAIISPTYVIAPASALPVQTAGGGALAIDGTTQAGYTGVPLVQIDGASAGTSVIGLDLQGTSSIVRGLSVTGFGGAALSVSGAGCTVQTNYLGVAPNGTLAGSARGVTVGASGCVVGGTGAGQANVIAGNTGAGVFVSSSATGVVVRGNSIDGNGAPGIDLFPAGVNANDAGDLDTGANGKQNYPIVSSASRSPGRLAISFGLGSKASRTYTVDLYAEPSCAATPQGKSWLGALDVATDAGGTVTATRNFDGAVRLSAASATLGEGETLTLDVSLTQAPSAVSQFITATATDATDGTSELSSSCVAVTEGPASTVHVATTDGTATAPGDFTPVSQDLTFTTASLGPKTVSVPLANDSNHEDTESFTLALSSPGLVSLGAPSTATVTVTDDDAVPPPAADPDPTPPAPGGIPTTPTDTPAAGGPAPSTDPSATQPAVDAPPSVKIKDLGKSVKAKSLRGIAGTAADDHAVTSVQIAVLQVRSRGHASCRQLAPSGLLIALRVKAGTCAPSHWLTAKGTSSWSFALLRRLPPGTYIFAARAKDAKAQLGRARLQARLV
jgi:hypothetical protein